MHHGRRNYTCSASASICRTTKQEVYTFQKKVSAWMMMFGMFDGHSLCFFSFLLLADPSGGLQSPV